MSDHYLIFVFVFLKASPRSISTTKITFIILFFINFYCQWDVDLLYKNSSKIYITTWKQKMRQKKPVDKFQDKQPSKCFVIFDIYLSHRPIWDKFNIRCKRFIQHFYILALWKFSLTKTKRNKILVFFVALKIWTVGIHATT